MFRTYKTCASSPVLTAAFALLALAVAAPAAQAVQIQDIVRIKGAEGSKLVGMGLVVGLNGTGDGGKFLPAMRPLAQVIGRLIDPNVVAAELSNADNVALVSLTASLPSTGVREGDRVDVHIASVGPAQSLEGGRLFMIPMTGPVPDAPVYAFAEGPVVVENPDNPNTGIVPDGAQLTKDVITQYLDDHGRLQLVINNNVASWPVANNVASLINGLIAPDGPNLARAIDQKNVVVAVPEYQRRDPAAFISQILQTYIDPSQVSSGAKVVINERTGTIVVTGEVEVSPVIISHKGLTITTLSPEPPPDPNNPNVVEEPFLAVDPDNKGGTHLSDLLAAFNQLKVQAKDRIEIIKTIAQSGKLHAQLIME